MHHYIRYRRWWLLLLLIGVLIGSSGGRPTHSAADTPATVYLPLIIDQRVWPSPFGFESGTGKLSTPAVSAQVQALGPRWVRLNAINWRQIQPAPDSPYNWDVLAAFERDLATAAELNLTPLVIVDDSPDWATIDLPYYPYKTSCAAIRDERLADFARFLEALIERYPQVQYWELGNEPDVDPRLVSINQVYGCWGDIDDPFYGGERYGRMVQFVAPVMRAANPQVKIVIGGLLLNTPITTKSGYGTPERFFEGILRSGAADSFDVVAYHAYPNYWQAVYDLDMAPGWYEYGGVFAGKARFLRGIMAQYSVQKPLFMNEGAIICRPELPTCSQTNIDYINLQADLLLRGFVRALNADVRVLMWYTLDGPGWRWSGLLDSEQHPRPVYHAYHTLIDHVRDSVLPPPRISDYGTNIEAYRFVRGNEVVDVAWSLVPESQTIQLPAQQLRAVYSRDGAQMFLQRRDNLAIVAVPWSGVYIHRSP